MAILRRSDVDSGPSSFSRQNIVLCCISRHPTAAGGRLSPRQGGVLRPAFDVHVRKENTYGRTITYHYFASVCDLACPTRKTQNAAFNTQPKRNSKRKVQNARKPLKLLVKVEELFRNATKTPKRRFVQNAAPKTQPKRQNAASNTQPKRNSKRKSNNA